MITATILVILTSLLTYWLYKKFVPYYETIKKTKYKSGVTFECMRMTFDGEIGHEM